MRRPWRTIVRAVLALAVIVALVAILTSRPAEAALTSRPADAMRAADWYHVEGSDSGVQIFTPADGSVIVKTATGVRRSDDLGVSWRKIELPGYLLYADRGQFAVSPLSGDILISMAIVGAPPVYGLVRSLDGGATWTPPTLTYPAGTQVYAIAFSPAAPDDVYAVISGLSGPLVTYASGDGGVTWTERHVQPFPGRCSWRLNALLPHPHQPERLYRWAGCYQLFREAAQIPLEQSVDRGATWQPLASFGETLAIAGADRSDGGPRYAATIRRDLPRVHTQAVIVRRGAADTDAWEPALRLDDAIGAALTYDPQRPQRVYVGFRSQAIHGLVMESLDGGASWSQLGTEDLTPVHDLALSRDGSVLFAATGKGIWRYVFPSPAGE